jgi:hypothetical protein
MSAAAPILPDLRLIQAATAIDIAYTRDRLAVIAGAPGNPFGVEIRDFGRGTAFQARAMPSPNFNRAVGFTVTLYETSSCAWEFHHPGERRRWPDLRASLSQACRTTSPGSVGDDLLPTVSP